jgi:hypothetical protein
MGFPTAPTKGIDVRGTVYRLSLLLLALGSMPSPSSAAAAASTAAQAGSPLISFAEQPVRLWRDTGVYGAVRGTRLQDGDIVAAGASAIQVETGSATVALGPATQVYLRIKSNSVANAVDFVLLNGWMKIQSAALATAAGNPVSASAGGLRVGAAKGAPNGTAGSAVILHASPGATELFVESGAAVVDEAQAGKRRQFTLAREQYAVKAGNAKQPMKLLPRPSKQFLADMPPVFADRLVPLVVKVAASAPKLVHPAVFAEVAPWLADEPALRQAIQRRLAPRKPGVAPVPARVPAPAAAPGYGAHPSDFPR